MTDDNEPQEVINEAPLVGMIQIARYMRITKSQARHALEARQLPAYKILNKWHMRPSRYLQHIEALEAETLASRK